MLHIVQNKTKKKIIPHQTLDERDRKPTLQTWKILPCKHTNANPEAQIAHSTAPKRIKQEQTAKQFTEGRPFIEVILTSIPFLGRCEGISPLIRGMVNAKPKMTNAFPQNHVWHSGNNCRTHAHHAVQTSFHNTLKTNQETRRKAV